MGLAAFSNPMRTNKFKRDLPPILGTPEFLNHPNGGVDLLPSSISCISDAQHEISSTGDLLGPNLQISAYGNNGEIETEFLGEEGNGCGTDDECGYDQSHTELTPKTAVKQIGISFNCTDVGTSVGLVRSLSNNSHPPGSQGQRFSVSDQYFAPDSPTPSTESMKMSRNTIPVGEQLEEIRIQNIYAATKNKKQGTDPGFLTRSLSLSGFLKGRGKFSDKDLIKDLQGGLFDADEDFSKELKYLENHSDHTEGELESANLPKNTFEDAQEDRENNFRLFSESSAADDDDIELLSRVYDEIQQWQYSMKYDISQM